MEQLDFKKWGVDKVYLYDNDGIALISSSNDDENGELFNVAHTLLASEEEYSLFHFAGKKMLLTKDAESHLLICTIAQDSPLMKAVHFLPEIRKEIASFVSGEE
ncbi:hypothetical protein KAH37_04965 [bacterium]|nr:hypothetical protein [bacterium]